MWNACKEVLKKCSLLNKTFHDVMMLKIYVQVNLSARKRYRQMSKGQIEKLKNLKDICKGERCFIIGTGPSLTVEALDKIIGEKSFAVNSAYLAYEHTKWRPNYYVITDDSAFDILGKGCYQSHIYDYFFLGTNHDSKIPNCVEVTINSSNHFLINTVWNKLFGKVFPIARFSKDISKVLYGGKTVIYPTIQIAAYMGFKEIFLLGVDCSYKTKLCHADFVEGQKNEEYSEDWALTTSEMMIMQFEEMKKIIPKEVRVYNATQGGNLEVFPRKKLSDVL